MERKMQSDSTYVGIDAGSVSLNAIVINQDKKIIYEAPTNGTWAGWRKKRFF